MAESPGSGNLLDELKTVFPPDRKETCSFGSACYRLNRDHLRYKKHKHLDDLLPAFIENPKDESFLASNQNKEKVLGQLKVLKAIFDEELPKKKQQPCPESDQPEMSAPKPKRGAIREVLTSIFGRSPITGDLAPPPPANSSESTTNSDNQGKAIVGKKPTTMKNGIAQINDRKSCQNGVLNANEKMPPPTSPLKLNNNHIAVNEIKNKSSTFLDEIIKPAEMCDLQDEECSICLEEAVTKDFESNKFVLLNACDHGFHMDCLRRMVGDKAWTECPNCKKIYGIRTGNQPPGTMNVQTLSTSLPGFEEFKTTIAMSFIFPAGVQDDSHPNPGSSYKRLIRSAYLPGSPHGLRLLEKVSLAFARKMLFTIDKSRTTGIVGITFNDIHLKTAMGGGPLRHGYPDPGYLDRLDEELKNAGITDQDLTKPDGTKIEKNPDKLSSSVQVQTNHQRVQDVPAKVPNTNMNNGSSLPLKRPTPETGAIPKAIPTSKSNHAKQPTDDVVSARKRRPSSSAEGNRPNAASSGFTEIGKRLQLYHQRSRSATPGDHQSHDQESRDGDVDEATDNGDHKDIVDDVKISTYSVNVGKNVVTFGPHTPVPANLKFLLKRPTNNGTVASLKIKDGKRFGFISPEGQAGTENNVFFHLDFVKNRSDINATLRLNTPVKYILNKKTDPTKGPKASMVFIGDDGGSMAEDDVIKLGIGKWLRGEVVGMSDTFFFILVSEVKVKVLRNKISKMALPVRKGDRIDFVLADRGNKTSKDPFAKKAKIGQYVEARPADQLRAYFSKIVVEDLEAAEAAKALTELLTIEAMWTYFANLVPDPDLFLDFVDFLSVIMFKSRSIRQEELMKPVLMNLTSGPLFKTNQDDNDIYVNANENRTILFRFCKLFIATAPELVTAIKSLGSQILLSFFDNSRDQDKSLVGELFEMFIKASCPNLDQDADHGSRANQAVIPNNAEVLGDSLDEDNHLTKIKLDGPYPSTEDYMDCFYRLLRAETFTKIQKGVQDFVKEELDYRDMYIYTNVTLVGICTEGQDISIALKFKVPNPPSKNNKKKGQRKIKWEVSPHLMFGNLLCISPSQEFNDAIWATVYDRDNARLAKDQIILVRICENNDLSYGEILNKLRQTSGRAVMAESPTYFQALSPVLNTIRTTDIDTYKLSNEIVFGKTDQEPPEYLQRFQAQDPEAFKAGKTKAMSSLDPSQKEAFEFACENRLAIVQGPPGCGKTYIGVKLAEFLLKATQSQPILVLTYKNHALDEFLKHMIPICGLDNLIRIGSQSKEPELEDRKLHVVCRRERRAFGQITDAYFEKLDEITAASVELKQAGFQLDNLGCLRPLQIVKSFTDEQIDSLMLGRDWTGFKFDKKTFAGESYVKKLIYNIKATYQNWQEFILAFTGEDGQISGKDMNLVESQSYQLLNHAVVEWLPIKADIQQMRNMLCKIRVKSEDEDGEADESNNNADNGANDQEKTAYDEDMIKEAQALRESALVHQSDSKHHKPKQITFLGNMASVSQHPYIYQISDFPDGIESLSETVRNDIGNLWSMELGVKIQFLYSLLLQQSANITDNFDKLSQDVSRMKREADSLDTDRKLDVARKSKIIGVTITGAAIQHKLIQRLRPKVVIIEEAGEILEPSLLAALSPTTEHLILIGDHKQLKPGVETFKLWKDYCLNTSMMERLITIGYPFKTLSSQSRMRPEFAALLHDIYPKLQDNLAIVNNNKPLDFMSKSMFFLHHELREDEADKSREDKLHMSRSKTNDNEAELAVGLALLMLRRGVLPKEITILVAYLGQKKVIREKLKIYSSHHELQSLFGNDYIDCQTIDMFQGDENKYIIVSLVRSEAFGFIDDRNRRCVAQSRAKNGLYFIGNRKLFVDQKSAKANNWTNVIEEMKAAGCVGPAIGIQCPKHKESVNQLATAKEMVDFVDNPSKLCGLKCGVLLPCKIKAHSCSLSCGAVNHRHDKCFEKVEDVFPNCGHETKKACWEDLDKLICTKTVEYTDNRCGHTNKKKCHQDEAKLSCKIVCNVPMDCGIHKCKEKCGNLDHSHSECSVSVTVKCSDCDNDVKKPCHLSMADFKCTIQVLADLPCGHKMPKKCFENDADVKCTHPCAKTMNCSKKHKCKKKCSEEHSHDICEVPINYKFPKCGHSSPKQKFCTESIKWPCRETVKVVGCPRNKNHIFQTMCGKEKDTKCPLPCNRKRKCGHPCGNWCGDDCEIGECKPCSVMITDKITKARSDAAKELDELTKRLKNTKRQGGDVFKIENIDPVGPESWIFNDIKNQTEKYVKDRHQQFPHVSKVEKIINLEREKKFAEAKTKLIGDPSEITKKFHGTSEEGLKNIPKDGFRLPNHYNGMYGNGVYFATDSTKSLLYNRGTNRLLICDVLLGKTWRVDRSDKTLDFNKVHGKGYDSVFAPATKKPTARQQVYNDEFIVYNPDQAIAKYIVHFVLKGNKAQ